MNDSGRSIQSDRIVLLHVSDLHIGTALMPPPAAFHTMRSGYNPHEWRLLRPLRLAIAAARHRLQVRDDELYIVISGDLTQGGVDNDYATAMTLLHHGVEWRFGEPPSVLGFNWPRDRTLTVPGNHDHWRHPTRQVAFTRGLAPDWFERTPWKRVLRSTNGTLRLELYGIDSNSGLENASKPGKLSIFARGEISNDELETLEEYLSTPDAAAQPGESLVRVLVCHHGFSNSGGLFDARPLIEDSRAALLGVAGRFGVSVALTGHTHTFHVEDWPVHAVDRQRIKELRCASTLQATRQSPGLQGFWMHEIVRDAKTRDCQWTAWKYQAGGKTFELDAHAPVTFVIPAERASPAY
jgi:3',5'-cyclic AMP phosphodiesterase CpdA